MIEQQFDLFHFFLFVIPGFITVWSFRYFTDSKKIGDFEYFALSTFVGILMLLLYGSVAKKESVAIVIQNPYVGAIVLSVLGLFMGWIGSRFSRAKFFRKIIHWLKNFDYFHF